MLVCTIPDHQLKGITNVELAVVLRGLAPEATIVVTAETLASARAMYEAGADYVFTPRLLAASYLAELVEHVQAGTDGPLPGGVAPAARALDGGPAVAVSVRRSATTRSAPADREAITRCVLRTVTQFVTPEPPMLKATPTSGLRRAGATPIGSPTSCL